MNATEIVLALLCVTLGAAVQSSIGFGASLVSIPLLLLINPVLVPGPALVAGLTVNLIGMGAGLEHTDWRGARWAVVGLLPGTAVAALVLSRFTGTSIAILSALAVLAAVGVSAAGLQPGAGRRTLLGAGFFSGYLNTTAGVGGPPMALAYQDAPAKTLRATLPVVFLAATVLTMVALARTGHLDAVDWRIGLILAPGGAIGYAATRGIAHRIDGDRLRSAVLVISAVSALAALARVLLC
ncbi:sulfite exporter TauE/SafE family protein [Aquihabitans sp. McL0605]|uniref:sulfite exporter TauE/SafE family protein n=1 Tax=Aquihabitans sp. McL0605 TaxID=3415671 RepID=UPI003CF0E982